LVGIYSMAEPYPMEKWVWTEADFERMGWHDSQVHALAFSPETSELLLDIDYIFEWIHPEPSETYFKFWTAPATLIFENVYDVDFIIGSYSGGLEIDGIKREDGRQPRNAPYIRHDLERLWTIDCQEGEIKLRSAGYTQYIRAAPQFGRQKLELSARGGCSFKRGRTDAL